MTYNKSILKIILAVFILGIFLYLCVRVNFIQDDSYISLQYAKNLVEGNGLVFNNGQKVEGFTSFLWVIILTIPYLIKISPELFIQSVSVVFGELCLLVTFLISEDIFSDYYPSKESGILWSFLPVSMLAVSGTFYYWSVSGMETTFFTFLCLMGILFYLKKEEKLSNIYISIIFLTLAFLTRQEAVIIIFVLGLQLLVTDLKANGKIPNLKSIRTFRSSKVLSIFFIIAALFLSLRYLYFGYLLPNTFYAKTGTSAEYLKSGIQYTLSFYRDYLLYGFMFIGASVLMIKRGSNPKVLLLYLIVVLYTLYIILIGGDVLALHRFFVPALPLFFILFTGFVVSLYHQFKSKFNNSFIYDSSYISILLILITILFLNNFRDAVHMSTKENGFTDKMKIIASVLKKESHKHNENLLVASCTVGNLKYFAGCEVLDMLGLTDKYIAHNSSYINLINKYDTGWKERNFNEDYVLSKKPDYIIFSTEFKPSSYAERALFTKEKFLTQYTVYPFLLDSIPIPFYVYKRLPDEIIETQHKIDQNNSEYSPSFVNDYNVFLNHINPQNVNNNFGKLEQEFDNLVKNSPSYFGEPYRFMGMVSLQKRDTVNALNYLMKCVKTDSNNLMGRIILYSVAHSLKIETLSSPQANYIRKYYPEIYSKLNEIN